MRDKVREDQENLHRIREETEKIRKELSDVQRATVHVLRANTVKARRVNRTESD